MALVPSTSLRQLVLACFASDALALGTHWVYDADVIRREVGRTDRITAPLGKWHTTKKAGDFTHFGDTATILLESLAEKRAFDLASYSAHFAKRWETLEAYRDKGTRETLAHLKEGAPLDAAGSESDDDIGHGSKFFPLLLLQQSEDELAATARQLTQFTQKQPLCHIAAEFVARVTHRILYQKLKPSVAIRAVADDLKDSWISQVVQEATAAKDVSDAAAASTFGTACYVKHSLPLALRFVLTFEDHADPFEALVADTQIGGNSAARNFVIAAMLYAYHGTDHPTLQELLGQVNQRAHIEELISKLGQ